MAIMRRQLLLVTGTSHKHCLENTTSSLSATPGCQYCLHPDVVQQIDNIN